MNDPGIELIRIRVRVRVRVGVRVRVRVRARAPNLTDWHGDVAISF